jgi:flagellar biosynthetic protein FliR
MGEETLKLMQTLTNLPLVAMILARMGGLVVFVPFFSNSTIPVMTRVLLAGLITLIVLPFMTHITVPENGATLLAVIANEFIIGLVFSLIFLIVFSGLELAGILIGQQLGIGLAQVFDPMFEEETSVLGQFYFWLALMVFILIKGHMVLLATLIRSFQTLPPGTFKVNGEIVAACTQILRLAFVMALQVAAPVLVVIFLITLAKGFVARTVPQINILTIGFNIYTVVGSAVIIVCLVPSMEVFIKSMRTAFETVYEILRF